jgi:hypothetical protein
MGTFDDDLVAIHKPRTKPDVESATSRPSGATTERRILQLHRDVGNAGVVQLLRDENDGQAVEKLVGGGGRPLDTSTQVQMESAFGQDFQDVRVHTGTDATASAQRLGAHAYTVGNDVVFSDGQYDPGSTSGQKVLAHELAHVVQQRSGPVDGTDTGTGVKVSRRLLPLTDTDGFWNWIEDELKVNPDSVPIAGLPFCWMFGAVAIV